MKLSVLALLPAVALAAPPPTANRMTALLIPLDQGAEASAPKLESWMFEALESFPGVAPKSTDELFSVPVDDAAKASLQRAEKGYDESRRAFEDRNFADAERKLRATLKEFQSSAGALTECGHFCDALAMYAAVLHKRGKSDQAKLTLLDLLTLGPTLELDPKRLGREIIDLRTEVSTDRTTLLRSAARVVTRPAGARVYLDGEFKGYSPLVLQTIPVGRHHLRVERPGFTRHGQLIDVTEEDLEVVADLVPTRAWKAWDAQMDAVAAEASKGGGASLQNLARTLRLDQAIIGTVKDLGDQGGTVLTIGLFDLRSGRRISHRRIVYQGDEFGQLEAEVGRLVNALLNAEKQPEKRTADPLDTRTGMEDWNREDRGGRTRQRTTQSNGDPLDSVSGMEDW
ncbi:MAG: PEGA domain-containing protein [Myxococcaceae bacterium]